MNKPARPTSRGLIYLRRSSEQQESSLEKQLAWALDAARKHQVKVDASVADLNQMQRNKLNMYKSICMDNAITGGNLDRPGLVALLDYAVKHTQISHVFAFKRDRLGRPEAPVDMLYREARLLKAGITLVMSDKLIEPSANGDDDLAQQILGLVDYRAAGQFRRDLSQQMIHTQTMLAKRGFTTGGNAPYGFVRALADSSGKVLNILPKGRRVRQSGCHVVWIPDPDDNTKINHWLFMLALKEKGWGYKRIATHMNELGIPSPHAGAVRHDHGVAHKVTGRWHGGSVKALLENRTLIACLDYGRRSEGVLRRLGPGGKPRTLEPQDFNHDEKPKTIWNDPQNVITATRNFEPLIDPKRWEEIRQQTRKRSTSQAGVPRTRDLGRYPLSCRVIDLTDQCHSIMYASTKEGRPFYLCGRYMNSGSKLCNNNRVDAEALLAFVLLSLRHQVDRLGLRDKVRQRLLELATGQQAAAPSSQQIQREQLDRQIEQLQQDQAKAQRNLAVEDNDILRQAIREEYLRIQQELTDAQNKRNALHESARQVTTPTDQVEQAMSLLDDLCQITSSQSAREQINPLLRQLGLWVGLRFVSAIKGKSRPVRRLAGGVIAFGDMPLRGRVDQNEAQNPTQKLARTVQASHCHLEDEISSTKVNRGDRI